MNGYTVRRETLYEHSKEILELRDVFQEGVDGFANNYRIALTLEELTWPADGLLTAYNDKKDWLIINLRMVGNELADISESAKVAAHNYGATEATIEKALASLADRLKKAEYERGLPPGVLPDQGPPRP